MDEASTSEEPSSAMQAHENFWIAQTDNINNMKCNDFKTQELPLARIKKIMKLDEEVKMISAEAPVLFSKAAEIFIAELSLRAWLHTEDNKRRTLQRNDIAMAITKYDQFDFLIDIVPRDELKTTKRTDGQVQQAAMMPEQVQYYFQLAQNQTATTTASAAAAAGAGTAIPQNLGTLIATTQAQQLQTVQVSGSDAQASTAQLISAPGTTIQLQQAGQTSGNIQHIITNTGEIQQVQLPVGQQVQYVRQNQGQQQGLQQAGQEFVTQIPNTQPPIYQIQTQSGTQQVFLQQPATTAATATAQ